MLNLAFVLMPELVAAGRDAAKRDAPAAEPGEGGLARLALRARARVGERIRHGLPGEGTASLHPPSEHEGDPSGSPR
jgi:hypothetical protein